jgi:tellurite resistance-related uncharacterized protein
MKDLPPSAAPYKRTPIFEQGTTPSGLLSSHSTKTGVWGKIIVLKGSLLYRILEPTIEEIELGPQQFGIVEPHTRHEVVPRPGVRFYIEFSRLPE